MKTITTLHNQILQREKIELVGHTCTKVALIFLFLFICSGITAEYFIFASQGIGTSLLTATVFFGLGLAFIVRMIWRTIATAYIRGEMLIVRYLVGKSKVTEISSIRTTRSIGILGIRFMMIRFKLDGELHSVLIFGTPKYIQDPKIIIDTIRKVA